MTPHQRELARHALGLAQRSSGHSYRNRFAASRESDHHIEWEGLVSVGDAVKRPLDDTMDMFHLTRRGAEKALDEGEALDPEDFAT